MGPSPAPAAATSFGKYSLVARLATGGMAEIFLARLGGAAGFEKLVCIKRILPHLARDKQFVAMFLDEARIAARISHPNVCQVFELGELDGSYYIAMEYLEGVPLACFRRRDYYGPMPDARLVAGLAIQACEGLHHAHQLVRTSGEALELVHRDISPQNLFVTVDGVVKVLDFGIAKIQDASVRTSTGAVKGTYAYMAPEQLRGERVDRRTDVFAMGIVMWETLTRRHLFKRDTDFLTFQAITTEPIADVTVLRPDVPAELARVIAQCLSRERDARPPTARALGEAIAEAVKPLAAGAISDEIARAFPAELAEQRALIQAARTGGSFDLNVERGPTVGHGAELLTTPVSNQIVSAAPISVAPRVVEQKRSRAVTIAASAAIVAAIGIAIVVWQTRGNGEASAPPPREIVALPAAVLVDAAPAPAPPDAAAVDAAPAPARPTPPRHAPPPAREATPSGPPGYITIDSVPVYATISIDGKKYGETPLVRVQLPPGRHVVHAVSPSGATRDVRISIESGKVAPASRIEW